MSLPLCPYQLPTCSLLLFLLLWPSRLQMQREFELGGSAANLHAVLQCSVQNRVSDASAGELENAGEVSQDP